MKYILFDLQFTYESTQFRTNKMLSHIGCRLIVKNRESIKQDNHNNYSCNDNRQRQLKLQPLKSSIMEGFQKFFIDKIFINGFIK